MKRDRRNERYLLRGLLAAAMLVMAAGSARAQATIELPGYCSNITAADDTDRDGFPDSDMDLTSYGGTLIQGEGSIALPSGMYAANATDYASTGTASVTTDATVTDLFVVMYPAAASYFPADILSYTEEATADGGLALDVHYLSTSTGERDITDCQRAVTLTEDTTAYVPPGRKETLILGVTTGGDTNYLDGTVVHTRRIDGYIQDVCGGYTATCLDSNGYSGTDLRDLFVKYVANHEVGHTIMLANVPPSYIEQYNGHHFSPDERVMLSQQAVYTKKGSRVTFYLTETFHPGDQTSRVIHTY